MRSFGNLGCCGWDTRAPFHLGKLAPDTVIHARCGDSASFLGRKPAGQKFLFTAWGWLLTSVQKINADEV